VPPEFVSAMGDDLWELEARLDEGEWVNAIGIPFPAPFAVETVSAIQRLYGTDYEFRLVNADLEIALPYIA
jgi:hypothetical protein